MNLLQAVYNALRLPELRNKLLFTAAMLVVFRLFANISIPGANQAALQSLFNSTALLGLLDLFSGGGLSTFSVVAMGVNPYINASIIMQLMTQVIPRLKALSLEGEYGRNRINQYTRYLTVPMGVIQAYGYLALLSSPDVGVITTFDITSFETLTQLFTLTAGTVLVMWIGELI